MQSTRQIDSHVDILHIFEVLELNSRTEMQEEDPHRFTQTTAPQIHCLTLVWPCKLRGRYVHVGNPIGGGIELLLMLSENPGGGSSFARRYHRLSAKPVGWGYVLLVTCVLNHCTWGFECDWKKYWREREIVRATSEALTRTLASFHSSQYRSFLLPTRGLSS